MGYGSESLQHQHFSMFFVFVPLERLFREGLFAIAQEEIVHILGTSLDTPNDSLRRRPNLRVSHPESHRSRHSIAVEVFGVACHMLP